MPSCRSCGATHEPDALEHHVHDGTLVVLCPDCHTTMGRYSEPGLRGTNSPDPGATNADGERGGEIPEAGGEE